MTMKLIVAALLLCVCFAEDTLVPFLVVKKDVSETHVVVGGSLTVNITISNKGASPAFSANVVDKSPDGTEQTAAFEKLAPGEVQTLSYVVRSDKVGDWNLTAAEVTYKDKEDAVKTRKAFSNLIREEEHVAYGEGSESRHVRGIVHVLFSRRLCAASQSSYQRNHRLHSSWLTTSDLSVLRLPCQAKPSRASPSRGKQEEMSFWVDVKGIISGLVIFPCFPWHNFERALAKKFACCCKL